eukprot:14745-Heterococcus_DN1.PRE.1
MLSVVTYSNMYLHTTYHPLLTHTATTAASSRDCCYCYCCFVQTFHTHFKKKFIDKGAALFRADTIYKLDKTFVLNYVNKHQTLEQLEYPPTQLDGAFFESLANTPGVKSVIIQRTLLVHL